MPAEKLSGVVHEVIHDPRDARGSADRKSRPDGPASVSGHHAVARCDIANDGQW